MLHEEQMVDKRMNKRSYQWFSKRHNYGTVTLNSHSVWLDRWYMHDYKFVNNYIHML